MKNMERFLGQLKTLAAEFIQVFQDKKAIKNFWQKLLRSEFYKETKRLALPVGIPTIITFYFTEQSVQSAAVIGAVALYFTEAQSRKAERHSRLWQAIDGAANAGVATSYARKQALEELANDGVYLRRLNLSNVDLVGANLSGANLSNANLSGANLSGADLSNASLCQANLSDTKLNLTNLSSADLFGADVSRASIKGSNLSGTNLNYANLQGAILNIEADLVDIVGMTDIQNANLQSVKNAKPEQIQSAKNWQSAKYDPAFRQLLGLEPETEE